jgi:ssDNA-binding replication factor A large subunit
LPHDDEGSPIKIKDITRPMRSLLVKGRIESKEPVDMRSNTKAHALAIIADESGEIALNLWRNQIEQVKAGDSVILRNAFAQKYRGKLELSLWGNIETF